MRLVIGNAWAFIEDAPEWFLDKLRRHLSVPVSEGTKRGERFGSMFRYQDELYGSMLHMGPSVPAGLARHVWRIAQHYTRNGQPIELDYVDRRERPAPRGPLGCVSAAWRPYQDEVHYRAMNIGTGVIDAPPRSGKTLMAARVIDELALPALYIAPTVAIVRQTYRVFCEIFGEDRVARLDGTARDDERDITKLIVIATAPSALKLPRDFYRTRDILILDEFHHSAAETYHRINLLAETIFHRFCFTGTYWRTAGDDLAMEAVCSRVLYRCTVDDLVPRYLAQPFVSYVPIRGAISGRDWRTAYQRGVVDHEQRNDTIAHYAHELAAQGIPTLVLVNRRAHADALSQRIEGSQVAKGGEGVLTSKTVRDFVAGHFPVLVGTSVLGEGVDVPNAEAVIYGSGGGASVQMMQSYFRSLTAHGGKQFGRVYDFRDMQHPTLQRHANDRIECAQRYFPAGTVQVA